MHDSSQPAWFVARHNKRYGPFSAVQLKDYAAAKRLLPDDKVRQENSSDWLEAQSLPWLFPPADSDDILDMEGPPDERAGPLSMKGIRVRPDFTLTYGDFQLLKKLGAGGMGAVYLALQRSQSRRVALKMLSSELEQQPSYVKRFYREALLLGALEHPNIVQCYGVGEEAGIPFFAMEYIDGLNAAQVLKEFGRLDVGDALHLILRCADALGYGHSMGIIHRDVTPGNILITRTRAVKLSDLGLAKPTNTEISEDTQTGVTMGTPRYMAPEQALNSKNADARSDIYSLGVVLYHFVTGQAPFPGDTAMEVQKAKESSQFTAPRRLNDNVSPRLDLLIAKMLSKEPRYRQQSCAELIRDIEKLGAHNARLSFDPDKIRTQAMDAATMTDEPVRLEILMLQADITEIRLAQELLDQKQIPANLNVTKECVQILSFLRREGPYASAPRPQLIILGHNATAEGSLAVLNEIKAQSLSNLPVAILTRSPEAVRAFFQARGLLDSVLIFKPEDRQLLHDLFGSAHDLCLTQAE